MKIIKELVCSACELPNLAPTGENVCNTCTINFTAAQNNLTAWIDQKAKKYGSEMYYLIKNDLLSD